MFSPLHKLSEEGAEFLQLLLCSVWRENFLSCQYSKIRNSRRMGYCSVFIANGVIVFHKKMVNEER